ncbi:MAG: hypothetical protein WCD76_06515 [Pyrinomonadaceae bacterium]
MTVKTVPPSRAVVVFIAVTLSILTALTCACSRSGTERIAQSNDASTSSSAGLSSSANASTDPAKLNSEIARLEKEAERNPGDDESRAALSQAYLRRGNSLRDTQKPREALLDYQRALRNNPDNVEAQKNIAEISPLVEGTPTAENGEPAPLPITPNVTDDDDDDNNNHPPAPARTPKKP